MRQHTVLILGEYDTSFSGHEFLLRSALGAAKQVGLQVNTRWMGSDDLLLYPGMVTEASAVLLAPGVPRKRLMPTEPLLEAIRLIREADLPFLALGSAYRVVVTECKRNLLKASQAEWNRERLGHLEPDEREPVLAEIHYNSHPDLFGTPTIETERLLAGLPDCAEEWASLLKSHWSSMAWSGTDSAPCLFQYPANRFHWAATFVPAPKAPDRTVHVLYRSLMKCVLGREDR
jgi:hypothetical protein